MNQCFLNSRIFESIRKKTYTAEAKRYYRGNVFVPEDLETMEF